MIEKYIFENRLNVLLSELLNQIGVLSYSEQLGKGRKDIIAYHQGLRIVIEGSYNKLDAERDAKKRIEQLPVDMAIAVYYPEKLPQTLLETEIKEKLKIMSFYSKVIVPYDISNTLHEFLYKKKILAKPEEEWIKVNLFSLANLIKEASQFIISEEHIKEIEDEIDKFITDFVNILSSHPQSSVISKNINDILFKLYGFSMGDPDRIKEVLFAQAGLALLLSSIYYETIRYIHKKDSLMELSKAKGAMLALNESIKGILKINYEPIFYVVDEILNTLPPINTVFQNLIDLATKIATKRTLLRRDLAGKVYHKIVGDWSLRKGLATYFTQIPSAYLLLYLAKPTLSRICDFACGSGTLLTAAYSAARNNYIFSLINKSIEISPQEINENFHKNFIENCYAFDVLKYATQITALNLAFHNPEAPLKEFNIYTLPLGERKEDGKTISLGSLEFCRIHPKLQQILTGEKVTKIGLKKEEEKLIKIQPFDLVVMNPPFTRAGGRWKEETGKIGGGLFGFIADTKIREDIVRDFKQLREDVKKILLDKAKKLLNNTPLEILISKDEFNSYTNIGQAGEGLLFLYLADKFTKEGGKIGFVLPKNLLSGVSWFLARTLLAFNYHVKYLVVSYDAESGYNFSESTNLSECLLVAKKTKEHKDNEITKFVMLLKKPQTSVESIALANEIEKIIKDELVEAGKTSAFIINIERKELLKHIDNWGKFIFLPNFKILEISRKLLQGVIEIGNTNKVLSLTTLNSIIDSIGIDAKQFGSNFKILTKKVPGCVEVVHGGGENVRNKMFIFPNSYALSIGKEGEKIFKNKCGRLLLPSAIRVNTSHVTSMLSNKPTLSSLFYVIKLKNENENKLKALCLWFNTTWGFLTILMNRQEISGGWIQLKMAQWRLLPVLNLDELSNNQLKELAEIFDRFKDAPLKRLTEQYDIENTDPSRVEIDMNFLKTLNIEIKKEELLELYKNIYSSFKQWIG